MDVQAADVLLGGKATEAAVWKIIAERRLGDYQSLENEFAALSKLLKKKEKPEHTLICPCEGECDNYATTSEEFQEDMEVASVMAECGSEYGD